MIYVFLGSGLGSFVYVDYLCIVGVLVEEMVVVGLNFIFYVRYEWLLCNC